MLDSDKFLLLKDMSLFKNIHPDELDFFRSKFSFLTYAQDDIILNGSLFERKACYFLYSGHVRVVRTVPNNNDVSYYDLEAPSGFGFENLYPDHVSDHKKDKAIVSAVTDVELFSINQTQLEDLLGDPRILLNFTQYILESYRALLSPPTEPLNNFRKTA